MVGSKEGFSVGIDEGNNVGGTDGTSLDLLEG